MPKRNLLILGAVGVVVLVVLGAGVLYFVLSGDDDNDTSNEESTTEQSQDNESEEASSSEEVKYNACELLPKASAEEIMENDVDEPEESNTPGVVSVSSCTYVTKYESLEDDLFTLSVMVRTSSKSDAQATFEAAKTSAYNSQIEDVNDLSAEAYWAPGLSQLSILKDDSWILVSALGRDDSHSKEMSIAAAEVMLANMD